MVAYGPEATLSQDPNATLAGTLIASGSRHVVVSMSRDINRPPGQVTHQLLDTYARLHGYGIVYLPQSSSKLNKLLLLNRTLVEGWGFRDPEEIGWVLWLDDDLGVMTPKALETWTLPAEAAGASVVCQYIDSRVNNGAVLIRRDSKGLAFLQHWEQLLPRSPYRPYAPDNGAFNAALLGPEQPSCIQKRAGAVIPSYDRCLNVGVGGKPTMCDLQTGKEPRFVKASAALVLCARGRLPALQSEDQALAKAKGRKSSDGNWREGDFSVHSKHHSARQAEEVVARWQTTARRLLEVGDVAGNADMAECPDEPDEQRIALLESQLGALAASNATRVRLWSMHNLDTRNTGDVYSTPFQFFPLLRRLRAGVVPVGDKRSFARIAASDPTSATCDIVIVGGGGLVRQDGGGGGWVASVRDACSLLPCFIWSVGSNARVATELSSGATAALGETAARARQAHHQAEGSKVVARRSRDHGAGLSTPWRYMIDASVFLPLERCHQRAPQHAVAFYNHAWVTPLRLWRSDGTLPPLNGPVRRNNIPVNSVVDLICSAHTLVTSSYHGALWALLAGRMVVIAQRADYASSKLFLMEHGERVPHVQVYRNSSSRAQVKLFKIREEELNAAIKHARPAPLDFLGKARRANRAFYQCVLEFILKRHSESSQTAAKAALRPSRRHSEVRSTGGD